MVHAKRSYLHRHSKPHSLHIHAYFCCQKNNQYLYEVYPYSHIVYTVNKLYAAYFSFLNKLSFCNQILQIVIFLTCVLLIFTYVFKISKNCVSSLNAYSKFTKVFKDLLRWDFSQVPVLQTHHQSCYLMTDCLVSSFCTKTCFPEPL